MKTIFTFVACFLLYTTVAQNIEAALFYFNKGEIEFRIGNFDNAINSFTKSIEFDPSKSTYIYRARAYIQSNKYKQALQDLNKVIEIDSTFEPGYVERGRLKNLLQDYEGAVADFTKSITLNNNKLDPYYAHYSRGLIYMDQGKYELALQDFDRSLELDPTLELGYVARGRLKSKMNRDEDAIADYNKCLQLNNFNFYALNSKCTLLQDLNRIDEAIEVVSKAIQIYPDSNIFYLQRCNIYISMKKYDEAENDINFVLFKDPNNDRGWGFKGVLYREMKKYDESISYLKKAIDLNASAENYSHLAISYGESGNFNKAIELLTHILDKEEQTYYFSARGKYYTKSNQLDEALSDLDKAVELDSTNAIAMSNRSYVLWKKQRFDKALSSASKSIAIKPDYADAYKNLSLIQYALGKKSRAIEAAQKAIELNYTSGENDEFNVLISALELDP